MNVEHAAECDSVYSRSASYIRKSTIMESVREYISENWKNTYHEPSEMRGDFTVPKRYMSPSMGGRYTDLFYWDMYFIDLGLIEDGLLGQVENNLDNMAYFIDKLGYMPNANVLTDRSQPPLFCSMVYDYYVATKDVGALKKYLPYILKEYDFWQTQRKAKYGLNRFFTNATREGKLWNYHDLSGRVQEWRDTEEEQVALAEDILAVAESGLDFNMRFKTAESKIDAHKFLQLDANCFLFEMEKKLAKILEIVGETKKAAEFETKAEEHKSLINKYLYDKEQGIYLDYNFEDGVFSTIVSAVSMYPYTYGISDDKEGAKKVLQVLEAKNGITVTPYRGEDVYYQWDYPCMWPAATCMVYAALKNVGLTDDAKRVAKKYIDTVDRCFEQTGRLWEKYDAVDGGIGQSEEYETPEMMGWAAGVYVYFCEELKRLA